MTSESSVARVHRGLAFLFLALALVNFFLAGLGAFGAESFEPHQALGNALGGLALIILVLAAVGRREALPQSAVLFVATLIQAGLGVAGEDVGILGGLHPVWGLFVMFAAHQAARALPLPFGGRRTAA